jgi:hypothetical protein
VELPSLSSLLPRSNWPYVLAGFAALAAIAALDALYLLGLRLAGLTTDGSVAAFDLDAEGSIACWLSVALLLLASQSALLVAAFSRVAGHGTGRLRAWLLLAALLLWMSLDEGASIHEGFKELMARACGTRIFGDGSIYWAVPYALALGLAGLFMLRAMWRDWPALGCLIGWAAAHLLAVAAQLELVLAGRWPLQIVVEEDAELAGYVLLLGALLLHARSLTGKLIDASAMPPQARADSAHLPIPAGGTRAGFDRAERRQGSVGGV